MGKYLEETAARRRAFKEKSGSEVAERIIAELVKQVQTMEWTVNVSTCKTLNVVALCDNDKELARQIVNELVVPVMRAAGWWVTLSCRYVLIRANEEEMEDDNDKDEDEDKDEDDDM